MKLGMQNAALLNKAETYIPAPYMRETTKNIKTELTLDNVVRA